MNRISRQQMFIDFARAASKRATCMRLSVGAVVVINNNVVSIGYNGAPSGYAHCRGNDCPGRYSCTETIHAEVNALTRVPRPLRDEDKDLYVTSSPCANCVAMLVDSKVKRLFFEAPYRITDHLDTLAGKVLVHQVNQSGYVVDWFTKQVIEE